MKQLANIIVKYRVVFALIFIGLIVFSFFSVGWVNVENDIAEYLPEHAEAKRGLTLMKQEFITYATADVMIENIEEADAVRIADELRNIDGVLMVTFDTGDKHYKDGAALYNISFSNQGGDNSPKTAMERVKAALSDYEYCVSSDAFSNLVEIIVGEMKNVLIIVIFVVIGVLVFTSSTYAEVPVLLLTFIAAAVINMGTNFVMGTISFISNSVAIVLQLALSVDYAIILCNRYKEEHETKPCKEAVASALALSIPEIFASSLTTIAGLTAMTFMQFRLGLDMGLALIKSIFVSLVTVFGFMPCLLVLFGGLMDRTKHKNFVPKISFMGKLAYAARFIIPPIFVVLVAIAYYGVSNQQYDYSSTLVKSLHKNEESIAKERIIERFGDNNMLAVMVPAGDYEKEAAFIEELNSCPEVNSVLGLASIDAINGYTLSDCITYEDFKAIADVDDTTAKALFAYYAAGNEKDYQLIADNMESYKVPLIKLFNTIYEVAQNGTIELPQEQLELIDSLHDQLEMADNQLQGENYSRIILYVDLPVQGDDSFAFLDRLHVIANKYFDDAVMTGNTVSAKGFADTFVGDTKIVSIFSVSLVMLILLFTFKSVGMPILLILVIQGSIWINFAIPSFSGGYVFFMCYLIVSAIQMGANIDYAIVISSRYNELRDKDFEPREAIIETLNLAFPTVITSGTMMVLAGLLIGYRVSQVVVGGMGFYVGTGTAISLVLVNLALPAILVFGDGFIRATSVKLAGLIPLRARRIAAGAVLTSAALYALIFVPGVRSETGRIQSERTEQYTALIEKTQELKKLAKTVDEKNKAIDETKYEFAEHLLTDTIGAEQLRDGEEQIAAGEELLAEAEAQLAAGETAYAAGYAQYQQGLEEYRAGEQRLMEGQAQYDEGEAELAQAKEQLEAGKAELAAGEERLAQVKPIYDTVMPIHNRYIEADRRANEAAENGNLLAAAAFRAEANQIYVLLNTSLGGYSIESLISEYQTGQAEIEAGRQQIADGEAQIAEAEAQLADAKAQLDAGYAELEAGRAKLDAGEAELAAARQQLEAGRQEIASGKNELNDAKEQLSEGRELVDKNREELEKNFSQLDEYADDNERLKAGMEYLRAVDGISGLISGSADHAEVCAAAEHYFSAELDTVNTQTRLAGRASLALIIAAVLSLIAVLMLILRRFSGAAAIAGLSALISGVCAAVWFSSCYYFGNRVFIAAVLLSAAAVIVTVLAGRKTKTTA